jgi:chorismate dehydratase
MPAISPMPVRSARRVLRVGAVSYLNTKPLIWGLHGRQGVDLQLDVPARLLEGLERRRFDVAMLPVIDYQRLEGLRLIPSAGIGSDGPTLTVRIFSRTPVERIARLACDRDSHTSVALARVILAERYGLQPELVDLPGDSGGAEAKLLIGDKVVREDAAAWPVQLDLGEAWKAHTGLPFVFAAWMARGDVELGDLPAVLEQAKRAGLANIAEIVERHAAELGWPAELAERYLTRHMQYDIGPRQLEAIRLFHCLAARHGTIPAPARELRTWP